MSRPSMKVAVNPLPWVLSDAGFQLSRTVLIEALADLRGVGFRALHAQVPDDMTVDEYRQTLADYGFVPAPGYFSADFTDVGSGQEVREQARHAAEERIRARTLGDVHRVGDGRPSGWPTRRLDTSRMTNG